MQRNWRNKNGKSLPRIEMVRDVLNNHIRKLNLLASHNDSKLKAVKVFCLAMGFKLTRKWDDVDLRSGQERIIPGKGEIWTEASVICDVLALAEIVPAKSKLDNLGRRLNQKCDAYIDK